MSLGIRKLTVIGLVACVFVMANALLLAHWLEASGAIGWAGWIRREFLTGTALTVIIALLILLVPARHAVADGVGLFRHCGVKRQLSVLLNDNYSSLFPIPNWWW